MAMSTAEPELVVSRETYAALLLGGETAEEALVRLEATPDYAKVIGSDAGQALLAAATAQVGARPNGGVKARRQAKIDGKVHALVDVAIAGGPKVTEAALVEAIAEADAEVPDDPEPVVQVGGAKVRRSKVAEHYRDARSAPVGLMIPIVQIEIAANVRGELGDLAGLAASIREQGILQPITVTRIDSEHTPFRVLEGHRRLAAAAAAGLEVVPALVDDRRDLGTAGPRRSAIQLVENLQRADLNAIDEAHAIAAILEADDALTHADVARWVGKDRSWVTNALRLLGTAPEVQAAVSAETISATHARAIAGVDVDLQARLLDSVVDRNLSAHETEGQAKYFKEQAERIRERATKVDQLVAKVVALLEKVANTKSAKVGVADYAGTGTELREGLEKAGWKVSDGYSWTKIAKAGSCGCDGVWRAEVSYSGAVLLVPACNSNEHDKARRAAIDEKWRTDQAKAQEERRLELAAAEEAKTRVKGAVEQLFAIRPAPAFARRLVVWGLLLADEDPDEGLVEKYLAGPVEQLYDLDDPSWTISAAIPDGDLEDVQARIVARLFGSYNAGPGVKAAVEAWAAENGVGPAAPASALVWRALRKSPVTGYTPSHLFPAGFAKVGGREGQKVLAACGFDWSDDAKNGYFDTVIDPAKSSVKAVARRCRKCETAGNATLEALPPADPDEEDLRPKGEVNVDALRGEADRATVDEAAG